MSLDKQGIHNIIQYQPKAIQGKGSAKTRSAIDMINLKE